MDLVTDPTSEKEEVHTDTRSECLGTLNSVKDLLQQYNNMKDEDKVTLFLLDHNLKTSPSLDDKIIQYVH